MNGLAGNNLAGLGRLPSFDERDNQYLLPRRAEATTIASRYWNVPTVLDQMDTPHCVGFSCWNWLRTGPIVNKPPFSPSDLYHAAQLIDEWEGVDYEGTSVRAGFKWMKSKGYVGEYRWAFNAEAIVEHLLTTGPIVVGTVWTKGMFMPHNLTGLIDDIGGDPIGGHAYLLAGASRNRKQTRVVNSWGRGWGDNGRAWLSFEALDWLMSQDGEACAAMEIKI